MYPLLLRVRKTVLLNHDTLDAMAAAPNLLGRWQYKKVEPWMRKLGTVVTIYFIS